MRLQIQKYKTNEELALGTTATNLNYSMHWKNRQDSCNQGVVKTKGPWETSIVT
jgi:hypothetical protein